MYDQKQTTRFSAGEIELIKLTFGGDGRVLNALRTLLWQEEVEDKSLLEFSPEVLTLLKKVLLPTPSMDIPLFQNLSLYQGLSVIRDMNPLVADLHIQANDILIQYLKQQFNELVTGDAGEGVILSRLPTSSTGSDQKEGRFVNILAYHNIGGYIEGRIHQLQSLSKPTVALTRQQQREKDRQNSTI